MSSLPKRTHIAFSGSVLSLLFVVSAVAPASSFSSSPPVASSSPLAQSTSKICRTYQQMGFGVDLGAITHCFAPNGAVYFYDNWTPQTNFSMNSFTFSLSKVGLPLSVTLWQNSTTVAYDLRASTTVLSNAYSGNIWVYFKEQGYDALMTIAGSMAGNAGVFSFGIPMGGGSKLSWCGPGCYSVSIGHLSFDWSADAASSSFDNSTKTLALAVGNSFAIDPIAKDGANKCSVNWSTASTCSMTFTTANSNDVLIEAQDAPTCGTTTSSPALSWQHRKSEGKLCDNYAVWRTGYGSMSVTCSLGSAIATKTCIVFGISEADTTTASVFDSNGCASFATSCLISTSNSNDMILGFIGCESAYDYNFSCYPTTGPNYSFLNLNNQNNCQANVCATVGAEGKIVYSAQSNLNVSWSFRVKADHSTYEAMGDAIKAYSRGISQCSGSGGEDEDGTYWGMANSGVPTQYGVEGILNSGTWYYHSASGGHSANWIDLTFAGDYWVQAGLTIGKTNGTVATSRSIYFEVNDGNGYRVFINSTHPVRDNDNVTVWVFAYGGTANNYTFVFSAHSANFGTWTKFLNVNVPHAYGTPVAALENSYQSGYSGDCNANLGSSETSLKSSTSPSHNPGWYTWPGQCPDYTITPNPPAPPYNINTSLCPHSFTESGS